MLALFSELGVDPVSVEPLIFAWKLDAVVPFEFSRSEFTEGCLKLGCDTIAKLKSAMRTCVLFFVSFPLALTNAVYWIVPPS